MKKLLSTSYSTASFNIAMLITRLTAGILLMSYGYNKLLNFSQYKNQFYNFLGLGGEVSLGLVIFAELVCAFFVVIGLFTRLFAIPPIIVMIIAISQAHHYDIFGKGQAPMLFLAAFFTVLLVGPGKASIDGMMGK